MKPNLQILSPTELREFSQIQKGRTELRVLIEFSIIIGLGICHHTGLIPFWTLPFVLLVIASRQHALLVLMHEGAHKRISQNHLWNNIVGEFIAWNFLASMHGYRRHHGKHHQIENLNTMNDPDWARKQTYKWLFPMRPYKFILMIICDILLLNTDDYIQEVKDSKNNEIKSASEFRWLIGRIIYSLALFTTLALTGFWKVWLLYWILPIFSFLKAIFRIRSICDHFCLTADAPPSKTRTVISTAWDRLLIGPCSIGVHGPHHLYPSIPYYNLRKAHERLMQNSTYSGQTHVTYGYHRAIGECLAVSP